MLLHALRVIFSVLVLLPICIESARAQLINSYVASFGNNASDCSRGAPCATFIGAIGKTAPGGRISCVDAGNFGGVDIFMSVTIDCEGTFSGPLLSGSTAGIFIQVAPTDTVVLRGLTMISGATGIKIQGAGVVHLSKLRIGGATAAVLYQPSGPSELYISESLITDDATPQSGVAGINLQPTNGSNLSTIVISNSRIENCLHGIIANGNSTSGGMFLTVADSVISGNSGNGITTLTNSGGIVTMLKNLVVTNNGAIGISNNGANTSTRLGSSAITGNGTGVANAGGVFQSYGNNQINGNFDDGVTLPVIGLK
jgi:hypothetical protein